MYAYNIEKEELVIQTKIVGSLQLTRDCDKSELESPQKCADRARNTEDGSITKDDSGAYQQNGTRHI
jgi:hypothetical protein